MEIKSNSNNKTHIHTYHSRFIPEGMAEVSQIFPVEERERCDSFILSRTPHHTIIAITKYNYRLIYE
jgi:hypothetical protein